MKKTLSTQIFRIDGKDCFVEILNASLPIKKFQFNFIEYGGEDHKQKQRLDIYMDALKAVALAERVLNGEFERSVLKAKRDGVLNGESITVNDFTSYFTDMGGISEAGVEAKFDAIKAKYPFAEKGKAISRQLKIQAGKKSPWVIRAEYGLGKSSDTGLIVPNGKPLAAITIPCSYDSLYQMAVAIKYSYQAYISQYYTKFCDDLFRNDTVNLYTPNT